MDRTPYPDFTESLQSLAAPRNPSLQTHLDLGQARMSLCWLRVPGPKSSLSGPSFLPSFLLGASRKGHLERGRMVLLQETSCLFVCLFCFVLMGRES